MNYNSIAPQYDAFERSAVTVWKLGYPAVCRFLGDPANRRILDYGCGSGIFTRYLRDLKAQVTGVDVSFEMIRVAQSVDGAGIDYRHIASGDLGFVPAATFDAAVVNFVLCTLPTHAEIRKILDAIRRILKPGGSLVVMNSNWDRSNGKEFISFRMDYSGELIPGKPVTATIKSDPPMPMRDFYWPNAEYLKMIRDAGFGIMATEEPLGREDAIQWIDEKVFPPYLVIAAKKN
ncbi:MAG TPA: methyltransferase domain-containing protein [Bacteroidales bacterium]|nr:methyltransferase domain-containing protein [Bacteroidales bacterium]